MLALHDIEHRPNQDSQPAASGLRTIACDCSRTGQRVKHTVMGRRPRRYGICEPWRRLSGATVPRPK